MPTYFLAFIRASESASWIPFLMVSANTDTCLKLEYITIYLVRGRREEMVFQHYIWNSKDVYPLAQNLKELDTQYPFGRCGCLFVPVSFIAFHSLL